MRALDDAGNNIYKNLRVSLYDSSLWRDAPFYICQKNRRGDNEKWIVK